MKKPKNSKTEAFEEEKTGQRNPLFLGMSVKEQIVFAKRLGILVKADVPILSALDMLKTQAGSRNAAFIIGKIQENVEKGQSLSSGMERFKNIFGDFAVNIVRVGEVSGTLVQNLNYLADELKKKQDLRRNIIGALVYPSFIITATIGIVILLMTYVFPKILPIFQSFKTQLPWSTKVLIAASSGFQHYWAYLLFGIIALAVFFAVLMKQPAVRTFADRAILRFPLVGPMFKDYQISNFTRTLGLLLKSEVGIIESLQIVAGTMGNMAYRKKIVEIARSAAHGERISSIMERDGLLFPAVVTQMAAVGETTGNLSSSLLYLAEMHEEEMNSVTKNLSTSIEPLLMVLMGLMVGFIALSIITPIYGITQNLRQ